MNPNDYLTSAYGVRMPPIIYGTAWKQERTASLVEQAIGLGFRGIDTACQPKHYNEAGVGDGIAASLQRGVNRTELYLQSKFTPWTVKIQNESLTIPRPVWVNKWHNHFRHP